MKRKFWIILLIIGIIPFVVSLIIGIYSSINGVSSSLLCFGSCEYYYGFKAFIDSIIWYLIIFWPIYIIGIILIIISTIKLKKRKKSVKGTVK